MPNNERKKDGCPAQLILQVSGSGIIYLKDLYHRILLGGQHILVSGAGAMPENLSVVWA